MKKFILFLLLIPGSGIASQESAHSEFKQGEHVPQIASSRLAPSSYAIGDPASMHSEQQEEVSVSNSESNEDSSSFSDRPTHSKEYYEQRVEALLTEIRKTLLAWEEVDKVWVRKALEDIALVKDSIALFEAIDHGDIEYVRTHLTDSFYDVRSVIPNFIYYFGRERDASIFSRLLLRKEGITPLMRASARGDTGMVKMFLSNEQYNENEACANPTKQIEIHSCMVEPNVEINMKDICTRLQRKDCVHASKMDLRKLVWDRKLSHHLGLLLNFDELTLAGIGGHEEIVDLLLARESSHYELDCDNIMNTLRTLSAFSGIAHLPAAQPLFKNLGISRPQIKNYPSIVRKLVKTLETKNQIKWEDIDTKNQRKWADIDARGRSYFEHICKAIMQFASTEVSIAIADELSHKPAKADPYIDMFQFTSKHGEKIGLILSMDSHPESLTFQLARSLLKHINWNPELLGNLRRYIDCNIHIKNAVKNHLVSDLAPIVADYLYPSLPAEQVRTIIALDNTRHDAPSLGEDMQCIMLGEQLVRNIPAQQAIHTNNQTIFRWVMQKMFEACRRRNL